MTGELLDLLDQAADEIASVDSPDNPVCQRIRNWQQRLTPECITAGELAQRINVSPREVLDAAIDSGVRVFWHEGQQFRMESYLQACLASPRSFDPNPELKFDLTTEQVECLAKNLGVTVEQLTGGPRQADSDRATEDLHPPRRFVGSVSIPPDQRDAARHRRSG